MTNETVSLIHASGGAGAILTLTKNGVATIQQTGSAPMIGPNLSITYSGEVTEKVTLPTDPTATSGTWTWTVVSGGLSATTNEYGYTQSGPVALTVGSVASGPWMCSGDAMTTSIGVGSVSQTYTLTRLSH